MTSSKNHLALVIITLCMVFCRQIAAYIPPNDVFPTVYSSISVDQEGKTINVTLYLNRPPGLAPCYVMYQTSDGTATVGADYTMAAGVAIFDVGQWTNQTVKILALVDAVSEGNETFYLNFTGTIGCHAADSSVQLTILDNAPAPTINIPSLSKNETWWNGNTLNGFPISLPTTYNYPVYFSLAFDQGTVPRYMFRGTPFDLVFPPGYTMQTFEIVYEEYNLNYEPDYHFYINIVDVKNAIAGSNGTFTILNDDPPPIVSFSVSAPYVSEGSGQYDVNVTLDRWSGFPTNVSYAITEGTATFGTDFSASNGTLTFAPHETSKTISIMVLQDTLSEMNETFSVSLFGCVNCSIGTQSQIITILDDDPLVACSIVANSPNVAEAAGTANFTISLSAVSGRNVSVQFSQVNGTADNSDFTPVTSIIFIPAGSTSAQVSILIVQDSLIEPSENFTGVIDSAVGCTISTGSAVVTILDDDTPVATSRRPGVPVPSRSPLFKSMAHDEPASSAISWWPSYISIVALFAYYALV